LQFVCVESLVTALVDMYPTIFRKKNRRETLILLVSILSYLVGLVMLTEVFWAQITCMVFAGSKCLLAGTCQVVGFMLEMGELHPAVKCLKEASLPCSALPCLSLWCLHFPFQSSSLVPVTVLTAFLPGVMIGALDSQYFGYKFSPA